MRLCSPLLPHRALPALAVLLLAGAQAAPTLHLSGEVSDPSGSLRQMLTLARQACVQAKQVGGGSASGGGAVPDDVGRYRFEAFYALGRYARYETGPDYQVDMQSCAIVDRGPFRRAVIEADGSRYKLDMVKGKGSRVPLTDAGRALRAAPGAEVPGAAALAALMGANAAHAAEAGAPADATAAAAAGGGEEQVAGQRCSRRSLGERGSSCVWQPWPKLPAAQRPVQHVVLKSEVSRGGRPGIRAEVTQIELDQPIDAARFQPPAGLRID
ncbi:hypothetical protein [Chitinimonas koreensis]|uniref:hypothetical protein n=1 Tax=Chitinimonas koreensis TaxID=356302 RepID=UPI0003F89EF7|nr:hypothetical protein [Chitinimonas koreensis]QNM97777.1 hypothetical protein H9L41_05755 [Chitinimonas koreensis]